MATIKMNECRVSRRGKAAKGTVLIKTFGIPVKTKKDGGVTKKWKYDFATTLNWSDLVDAVRAIGNINQILLIGADAFLKSNGLRSQSEVAILSDLVMAQGLALDLDEAKAVAIAIRDARAGMQKLGFDAPSVESFLEKRKEVVDKLKASGNWKLAPKLVKPVKDETPEPEEVEEDEDTEEDDTEDEDDATEDNE